MKALKVRLRRLLINIFNFFGYELVKRSDTLHHFHNDRYLIHNQRVQEHLASLSLDIVGKKILEVGAGIGDHTSFFLDRQCQIMSTDARESNLEILQARFPKVQTHLLDLESPQQFTDEKFDIVYCYGVLYHLKDPAPAIAFLSKQCSQMMLVETCVSLNDDYEIHPCPEPSQDPTQAISGQGCRPARKWVYNQLKQYFDYVYLPITQPSDEEFPIDWTVKESNTLNRAIFIASRSKIENNLLHEELLPFQKHR